MSSFFANVIIIARFQTPDPPGRGPLSFASRGDAPPAHDVTSTADTNDNDLRWCMRWRTLRLPWPTDLPAKKRPSHGSGAQVQVRQMHAVSGIHPRAYQIPAHRNRFPSKG